MYGVENRFKMQLLLGLKGSPLVGVRIVNFVPPDLEGADPRGQVCLKRIAGNHWNRTEWVGEL